MMDFVTKILAAPRGNVFISGFMMKCLAAPQGNTNKLYNTLPEGLIVSPVGLHIILLEGLRFPKITKLSPKGLRVLSGGISHENNSQEALPKSCLRDLVTGRI